MAINVIAATDITGGIARNKQIPWYYPEDFKHFKKTTEGGIVIVGRNTYEEIMCLTKGKGLVGRTVYVMTSNETIPNSFQTFDQVEQLIADNPSASIFFAGGEQVFQRAVEKYADKVILTLINKKYDCTEYFPMGYIYWYFKLDTVEHLDDPDLQVWTYTRKR